MTMMNSMTPTSSARACFSTGNKTKTNAVYPFPVQKAPPMSIQHHLRLTSGVLPGNRQWQPTLRYHPPLFTAYLPTAVRKTPKVVESVWHVPGPYRDERPSSLSPEKRPQQIIKEPVWKPVKKMTYQPVAFFDPPSLRWSLQELRQSFTDTQQVRSRSARSKSAVKEQQQVVNDA
jgi:hypothetical protein